MRSRVAALLLVPAIAMAGSMTITTNSVKVLPAKPILGATAWTNGIAVAQGQIIEHNNRYFMAEAAIASATNEPVHVSGISNNLRAVARDRRKAAILHNGDDATDVWINVGGAAAVGSGFRLPAKATATFESYQHDFYAYSAGSVSLAITEVAE